MKIGVLSDTHLSHVTKELREIYDKHLADKDIILHAGDIVSIEVVDFLRRKEFYGVHGNMDPSDVKDVLPEKMEIKIGRYNLGLVHGFRHPYGQEERIRSEFNDVDIIIYGHSHRAINHEKEGVLFFNPGTATGFSSRESNSIGVLELGDTIRGKIIEL